MSPAGPLQERDRPASYDEPREPPPPTTSAARARRLLALAAVVAALVGFTTLARPRESPSARLRIGESQGPEAAAGATENAQDLESSFTGAFPAGFLRPLDPATLADVPANLLQVGGDQWPQFSDDGALLALSDGYEAGGGEVRVLDAGTLRPVASVPVGDRLVTSLLGVTADAVVVQLGGRSPPILMRLPLDPEQPTTSVELPDGTETAAQSHATLSGGRVAMVLLEGPAQGPNLARVVVADLLAQRIVVDLALPGLRIDSYGDRANEDDSWFQPGLAWDTARERLYVAHADSARITVVDLAAGTILAEAEVGTPLPDLGEQPAQRWRWAQVSPDGTRLYLTGMAFVAASGSDEPFGLSVMDTATLAEVGRMERVLGSVQLSPDGRWLLWPSASGGHTAIMNTGQVGLVTLFGGQRDGAYPLGFSRDSSRVYLQHEAEGETGVVAYALPSLDRIGERKLPRGAWFDPLSGLLHEPE